MVVGLGVRIGEHKGKMGPDGEEGEGRGRRSTGQRAKGKERRADVNIRIRIKAYMYTRDVRKIGGGIYL